MRTLRIDLVILGLSLTAASSFRLTARLVNGLSVLGFVVVVLSALVAVVVTLGSDYPTGVSEAYVEEFQRASWSEREWNGWMLREYSEWLSEAERIATGEARLLFYARSLLGVGLLSLVVGATLGLAGVPDAFASVRVVPGGASTLPIFK